VFDKMYVEKCLYDSESYKSLKNNLQNKIEIEYCTADEICASFTITEKEHGCVSGINTDSAVWTESVFVGGTITFLESVPKNYAAIAVLSSDKNDDLFKYRYAVDEVTSIDYNYLEMIFARFNGLPLEITETKNLIIKEMTLDEACRLFELSKLYPFLFENSEVDLYNSFQEKDKLGLHNACDSERIKTLAAAYIENAYDLYGYGIWSVFRKCDEQFIGFAGLYDSVEEGECYTAISYYVEEQYRKCGYATEAALAVLKYAEEIIGIDEVRCVVREDNISSKKVAIRLQNSCKFVLLLLK